MGRNDRERTKLKLQIILLFSSWSSVSMNMSTCMKENLLFLKIKKNCNINNKK